MISLLIALNFILAVALTLAGWWYLYGFIPWDVRWWHWLGDGFWRTGQFP